MTFFELHRLRAACGGQFLQRPAGAVTVEGIGIDTRQPLDGKAYVAIRGERYDGHAFLADAVRCGARLLVVDQELSRGQMDEELPEDVAVIQVDDTRQALGRLASAYRRTWTMTRVIAVTGSCGKTTTKEMIHHVLGTSFRGRAAPRSFNNDIGVPLTLLSVQPGDQYVVLEVGTSSSGEIGRLSAIAEPDIAVITMIGRAHLEHFGTVEAIAKEKAALVAHLDHQGLAIVTADAPELRAYLRLADAIVLFGESDDADLRLTGRGRDAEGWWLTVNGRQTFRLGLPGSHNAQNALAAIAVARRFGLRDEKISRQLSAVQAPAMRLSRSVAGEVVYFNDAYNANPESMRACLAAFEEVASASEAEGRRIIVLGDMLELGPAAEGLHRELAVDLDSMRQRRAVDEVVLVGPLAGLIADELAGRWPAESIRTVAHLTDRVAAEMVADFSPGDVVLLKASRGMELERLIDAVGDRSSTPAETTGSSPEPSAGMADTSGHQHA